MIKTVDEYLETLEYELAGRDPALVQDALADAEEHLRLGLDQIQREDAGTSESQALHTLIEKYGEPAEVASAYKAMEERSIPMLAPSRSPRPHTFWGRLFGVYADPRAWGSFLYMLFGLVTGSFYGLWTLAGVSFSLLSLILIIGLPVTGLFLLSIRGIALMEGRIVEALLGVRMPRKPLFVTEASVRAGGPELEGAAQGPGHGIPDLEIPGLSPVPVSPGGPVYMRDVRVLRIFAENGPLSLLVSCVGAPANHDHRAFLPSGLVGSIRVPGGLPAAAHDAAFHEVGGPLARPLCQGHAREEMTQGTGEAWLRKILIRGGSLC